MNNFEKAFNNLVLSEGSYSNDPDDIGGETYMGISRRYHPYWVGWGIIDSYKAYNKNNFPDVLDSDVNLLNSVKYFYRTKYWDKFNGDKLPYIIAEELLEQSVNLGTWKTAGVNLQKALNLLNRNNKLFKDLKVDGIVGPKTLNVVKKVLPRRLLKVLNGLQFIHYFQLMKNKPEFEKFVGWFDRT